MLLAKFYVQAYVYSGTLYLDMMYCHVNPLTPTVTICLQLLYMASCARPG